MADQSRQIPQGLGATGRSLAIALNEGGATQAVSRRQDLPYKVSLWLLCTVGTAEGEKQGAHTEGFVVS